MSPLAAYTKAQGFAVTGSDQRHSHTLETLKNKYQIPIQIGHDRKLIEKAKTVVFSSAIKEENEEFIFAKDQKKKLLHRSKFINAVSQNKKCILVSGTHGKTTTSALIFHCLANELGIDQVSCLLGAPLLNNNKAWNLGKGPYLVIEADESDGSFLNYSPFMSVLTNCHNDHLDFYKTIEELDRTFLLFANNPLQQGASIMGIQTTREEKIFNKITLKKFSFGFSKNATFYPTNIDYLNDKTIFSINQDHQPYSCILALTGKHNVLNCLAAVATLTALGLNIGNILPHLKTFPGIKRRNEILFHGEKITLIDDYAHNPGKVSAAVESVSNSWKNHQIIVIFQPHRYSRTMHLLKDFTESFKFASMVYLMDTYSAGEQQPIDYPDKRTLCKEISLRSQTIANPYKDCQEVLRLVNKTENQKFVILTIGAGDITQEAHKLKKLLNAKKSKRDHI